MWFPSVLVPLVFDSTPFVEYGGRSTWQTVAVQQPSNVGFHHHPNVNDARRFMLMRSLFELVCASEYLELTSTTLLQWFLSLSVEDRALIEQEGGLILFIQKHPALEVTRPCTRVNPTTRGVRVHSPSTMSSQRSQCQNCGTSCQFGSKTCMYCGVYIVNPEDNVCVSENEKQLDLLPNCVRKELNFTGQNADLGFMERAPNIQSSNRSLAEDPPSCSKVARAHAQCLSQLWEEVENKEETKHFKDTTTTQASFSLDKELDKQSCIQRNDCTQKDHVLSYDHKEEAIGHNPNQEDMAEYYSFSSTSLDPTAWSDDHRHREASYRDSKMATKGTAELSDEASDVVMANATAANSTNCFSCLSNSFELADEDLQKKHDSTDKQQMKEINVGSSGAAFFVDQAIDVCGDFRTLFTSTCSTEVGQILQVKNAATDTDLLAVSLEKDTQTVQMATSEKNTITEVYMSDLDVLTEEFGKLTEMAKELIWLKSKNASPSSWRVCGCDCAQRVRRAELHLLALQFVMCRQHCWRHYLSSPLAESAHQGTKVLPDGIAETLEALQKDYCEMRRQILMGTPLDDLKPLSVDSAQMTTGTDYNPASVLDAHLNSFDFPGSTIASGHSEDKEERAQNTDVCQDTEADLDEAKSDASKREKSVVFLPKPSGASTETNTGAVKDPNGSEAWFDAKEELESTTQDEKIEKWHEENVEDVLKQSSVLCIKSLPENISQEAVLLWFEKYNATDVCISTSSNNMRTAIVHLNSPGDVKAAVKDLNEVLLQDHPVQLVQHHGPASTDKLNDQLDSKSKTHKVEIPKGENYGSSLRGLRCSVDRLTSVHDSPTASGTCVPQHYATMGSFDTIMARLSKRHPNVGRQRIVDALLELRSRHQGLLSGLPLRSIVDMTSELLTKSSAPSV